MSIGRGLKYGLKPWAWWQGMVAPPVLAVQFLTVVPVPLAVPAQPRYLGRALVLFPLAGAGLGVLLAALDAGLRWVFPPSVGSALILLAAALLTGGLHLDGLMDTCDGVFGGHTAARRLEIMRDSRVGSYGALAGVLMLLVKYATLTALPVELRAPALIAAPAAGRWSMSVATWAFPYARPEGLGADFKRGTTWRTTALATLAAAAVAGAALGPTGPALFALVGALMWLVARYLSGRLGGLTGDCYGALNELVEASVMLALVAGVVVSNG